MKIIIGAGGKVQDGWKSYEQSELDLLNTSDFHRLFDNTNIEAMLAEHVLEHIPGNRIQEALQNCYDFLAPNGYLRIAVPDGFHPDPAYIDYVKPGGTGAGADSHQVLYDYRSLSRELRQVGFRVVLLEWWDEFGIFNARAWNELEGYIERCLANDPRNIDGKPHYTSLIVDAFKDDDDKRPGLIKALEFVEENDPHKVSPFNRKKTTVFYELARLAPAGGVIVELGSYHGVGTAPLWYGARDGHRCKLICIDAYENMYGWAGEPYVPDDQRVWAGNIERAKIYPVLYRGDSKYWSDIFSEPISLLVHDLGSKNRMPQDVLDWERHIITGGLLAMRDIDDYSMGTEQAVRNLLATDRWGKRHNWDAFITSVERIA